MRSHVQRIGFMAAAVSVLMFAAFQMSAFGEDEWTDATVVYVVRHAEKASGLGRDPELSDAGVERANRLAQMLQDEALGAVFCTATVRSRSTGEPIAAVAEIAIQEYAPMDAAALASRIRRNHAGQRVLVVAHSNTVAPIVAALGGDRIEELHEEEYDRLFAVVLNEAGNNPTLKLRF